MTGRTALVAAVAGLLVGSLVGLGVIGAGAASSPSDSADRSNAAGAPTADAGVDTVSASTASVTDSSSVADGQEETESAFTAYGQQGSIVLGGDQDDPIVFPESDEDEPQPENAPDQVEWEDDAFVVDADVDLEAGTWEADVDDVSFPLITSYRVNADRAEVQMSAPDGFEGTIDPETGEMTAEAAFEIETDVIDPLRGIAPDSTCVTESELEMSTDAGDAGTPFEVDGESDTATATIVDDAFTVQSFDTASGSETVCGSASDTYGLPAEEPGDNEFELVLWFDLDGFEDVQE